MNNNIFSDSEPMHTIIEARTVLRDIYLDWINNYISIELYAEHNGLTVEQAQRLIELSREVFNSKPPEA